MISLGQGVGGQYQGPRSVSCRSRRCQLLLLKWETEGGGRRENKRKTSEKGQTGEWGGKRLPDRNRRTQRQQRGEEIEVPRSLRRDQERHA